SAGIRVCDRYRSRSLSSGQRSKRWADRATATRGQTAAASVGLREITKVRTSYRDAANGQGRGARIGHGHGLGLTGRTHHLCDVGEAGLREQDVAGGKRNLGDETIILTAAVGALNGVRQWEVGRLGIADYIDVA